MRRKEKEITLENKRLFEAVAREVEEVIKNLDNKSVEKAILYQKLKRLIRELAGAPAPALLKLLQSLRYSLQLLRR
jgi:hypothetical protein